MQRCSPISGEIQPCRLKSFLIRETAGMKRESTRAKRPATVSSAGSALPRSSAISATHRGGGRRATEQTTAKNGQSSGKIFRKKEAGGLSKARAEWIIGKRGKLTARRLGREA